jgi:hypothetical protein
MSDPREFERDPNLPRNRYVDSRASGSSGWIIAVVIAVVLVGVAAYSYRGTQMTSNSPETTSGQSTRAPVPSTPPATPVAPAPPAPAQHP